MTTRPGKDAPAGGRPNSLGLTDKRLEQLLDLLDEWGDSQETPAARSHARWPFRQASVRVRIEHLGGSVTDVRMVCRNLSRMGAGLLHSSFVHTGARCVVSLPHPDGEEITMPGEVVRCMHRTGVLHEIGVAFDREIDLRSFIRPDPAREWFTVERSDPAQLSGTVLYVEESSLDAQMVRHFIRTSQIRLRVAGDPDTAVEWSRKGADLILVDHAVDGGRGTELIRRLRARNTTTPVILVSADKTEPVLRTVDGVAAQAFLSKPLTQEKLVRALAEFLDRESRHAIRDAQPVDRGLIRSLSPELNRCARVLEDAAANDNAIEALSTCMQLRNVAPTIGMHDVLADIESILETLTSSMEVGPVALELRRVAARCRHAL